MNFNTILFPAFFALCALICWITPSVLRPFWLLAASLGFYCFAPENRQLIYFLAIVAALTWVGGLLLSRAKKPWLRRLIVWACLLGCLAPLVVVKQFSFFYHLVYGTLPEKILYPLGISYFTFQGMGYLIDQYRGKYPAEKNPVKYALFVSFFPCIFTGPIERYDHLMPQLCQRPAFSYPFVAGGAFRMLWGYFKKMVLADHLFLFVSAYYKGASAQTAGPAAVTAAVFFALQLYLDFSGCCDMAIGGARMMGFSLMENFDNPFLATSWADLWRRWHKSLTGWFRDYVYISLGGNRKGLPRWALNTLIVFGISGIWHGLDWGYLWWGVACGALLVAEQLPARIRKMKAAAVPVTAGAPAEAPVHTKAEKAPAGPAAQFFLRWGKRLVTFTEFWLCFILFAQALYAQPGTARGFTALFSGWNAAGLAALQTALEAAKITGPLAVVLAVGILLVFAVESRGSVAEWIRRRNVVIRWVLYYLLMLAILFFGVFGKSVFIYQGYF